MPGGVTWNTIRDRLTDPVNGADNWQAVAFGLLVAERFYPHLLTYSRSVNSVGYGPIRQQLNAAWARLKGGAVAIDVMRVSEDRLQALARHVPDSSRGDPADPKAVAAGMTCLHLAQFARSGDRDDIARLSLAACAAVLGEASAPDGAFGEAATFDVPFDDVDVYAAGVVRAPEVQSELTQQDADLQFVTDLVGDRSARTYAVARRAFA